MKSDFVDFVVLIKKEFCSLPLINILFSNFPKKQSNIKSILSEEKEDVSYIKFFNPLVIKRIKPKTIEINIHEKFSKALTFYSEKTFVLKIKNASVLLKDCFVVTPKGSLIEEINPLLGRKVSLIFRNILLPKQKFIDKKIVVLPNSDNYYHWMFETIPRLWLIDKSKQRSSLYISAVNNSFKKETLKRIGIFNDKLISSSNSTNITAKELIVSSLPIHTGNPTKEVCNFLRKNFLDKPSKKEIKKYEKIYVMRGNVKNRKVINEDEVIHYLSKIGFEIVNLDNLSVSQQTKIFASAKIVVAFHGAALANLVFCNKGTKVIEFFNPNYVNVCYWAISNCVGLDYSYFLAEDASVFGSNNVTVEIEKLGLSLKLFD